MDSRYDHILWDLLEPLPEDLKVPGTSNDRRGLLYVLFGDPPAKAYSVHGATGTLQGRTAELPELRLLGQMELSGGRFFF